MATRIFGSTSVGSGIRANLADGEGLYVAQGVTVGSTDYYCILASGPNHIMLIDGTVVANDYGIYAYGGVSQGTSYVHVSESGSIVSVGGSSAIYLGGIANNLVNDGTIRSLGIGMTMQNVGASGSESIITNHGLIDGGGTGIGRQNSDTNEQLRIVNTGVIKGLSSFNGSSSSAVEIITNSGTMIGAIYLEGGADTYDGRKGHVEGTVFGGAGDDKLYGGTENNTLDGGADDDRLYGGGGNDTLRVAWAPTASTSRKP